MGVAGPLWCGAFRKRRWEGAEWNFAWNNNGPLTGQNSICFGLRFLQGFWDLHVIVRVMVVEFATEHDANGHSAPSARTLRTWNRINEFAHRHWTVHLLCLMLHMFIGGESTANLFWQGAWWHCSASDWSPPVGSPSTNAVGPKLLATRLPAGSAKTHQLLLTFWPQMCFLRLALEDFREKSESQSKELHTLCLVWHQALDEHRIHTICCGKAWDSDVGFQQMHLLGTPVEWVPKEHHIIKKWQVVKRQPEDIHQGSSKNFSLDSIRLMQCKEH